MPTIILADDHPIVRIGLRMILESRPGLRVVGEAGNGLEALDLVERTQPDVLVVDLLMPGLHGLDVVEQAARRAPRTRSVVLTIVADEASVSSALRKGAAAYVVKSADPAELFEAIRQVTTGRRYLGTPFNLKSPADYENAGGDGEPADPLDALTGREREVFRLVAEGSSSVQIAGRLMISPRTVEKHRAACLRKLGLRTQTDVLRFALKRGLIPPG